MTLIDFFLDHIHDLQQKIIHNESAIEIGVIGELEHDLQTLSLNFNISHGMNYKELRSNWSELISKLENEEVLKRYLKLFPEFSNGSYT